MPLISGKAKDLYTNLIRLLESWKDRFPIQMEEIRLESPKLGPAPSPPPITITSPELIQIPNEPQQTDVVVLGTPTLQNNLESGETGSHTFSSTHTHLEIESECDSWEFTDNLDENRYSLRSSKKRSIHHKLL